MARTVVDLTGQRFGKLVVLRRAENCKDNRARWQCRCDCGAESLVRSGNLRSGRTNSCGCSLRKHGMHKSPEYAAWADMRQRCNNPKNSNYKNYGARGVTVCQQWECSFLAFLADMGCKPSPGHSLDRINVNGNYEPKNCKWSTRTEQNRNQRKARIVHYQGAAMRLADAAELAGIPRSIVQGRVRMGWPEENLFLPVQHKRPTGTTLTGCA